MATSRLRLKTCLLRGLLWSPIAILVALVLIDAWCETIGVPDHLLRRVEAALSARGVSLSGNRLKIGLVRGIMIEDCVLRDFERQTWQIIRADKIQLHLDGQALLAGRFSPTRARLMGGRIVLPVDFASDRSIALADIDILLNRRGQTISIRSLTAGCGRLAISARGNLHPGPARPVADATAPPAPLTLVAWWQQITVDAKPLLEFLATYAAVDTPRAEARLHIDFDVPLQSPGETRADLTYDMSHYRLSGVQIENFSVRARYAPGELLVSPLRLVLPENHGLEGQFHLDLKQSLISGNCHFSAYPRLLLTAIAPELSDRLPQFGFSGAPPSGELVLQPSPITDPTRWQIGGALQLDGLQFADAEFASLQVAADWQPATGPAQGGRLKLGNVHGRLVAGASWDGSGIYLPAPEELLLQGRWQGDPRQLARLTRSESFRKDYAEVWQDFAFPPGSKSLIDIELHRFVRDGRPALWLQGSTDFQKILYHGVEAQRARGDFYVDFPTTMAVGAPLEVMVDGAPIAGGLAFYFRNHHNRLSFDLTSRLDGPRLMHLINPEWRDYLADNHLSIGPQPLASGTGYYQFGANRGWHIGVNVQVARGSYYEAALSDIVSELRFSRGLTEVHTSASMMHYQDWALEQLLVRNRFEGDAVAVSGTVGNIAGRGAVFRDNHFAAEPTEQGWLVQSASKSADYEGWQVTGLDARSAWQPDSLATTAKAAAADYAGTRFSQLEVTAAQRDERIEIGVLSVADLSHADLFEGRGLQAAGSLVADVLTLNGKLQAFTQHAPSWQATDIDFQGSHSAAAWRLNLNLPQARALQAVDLTNAIVQIEKKADAPATGRFDVSQVVWADWGTGRQALGTFSQAGIGWDFDSNWHHVSLVPEWELTTVHARGSVVGEQVDFAATAGTVTYEPFVLANLQATAQCRPDQVDLSGIQASIYGGTIAGHCSYDFSADGGPVKLQATGLLLSEMVASSGVDAEAARETKGKLSGTVDLQLTSKRDAVAMTGSGQAQISEGNFLRIPLLAEFFGFLDNVVPMSHLADITELGGELQFAGDHIYMPDLRSNGTLVAIAANGKYWWADNRVDYNVRAVPLERLIQNVPLVNEVWKQLTVLLETRLTGTVGDYNWQMTTPLRNILMGKPIRDFFRSLRPKKAKDNVDTD